MKCSFHIDVHNKRLELKWSSPEHAPTAPSGNNGAFFATGSKYLQICPHSLTQALCSRSLLTVFDMECLLGTNNPSVSTVWNNIYAPLTRSSPVWGPTTP
eukprot:4579645-Ditylum_brightwellii.AAC.1